MSFTGMIFGISLDDYLSSAKSRGVTKVDVTVSEERDEDWKNQRRYGIFFEEGDGRRSWFTDRLSVDHLLFFDYRAAFNESYYAAVRLGKNGIHATFNGQELYERQTDQMVI